jgi:hypothetical protein
MQHIGTNAEAQITLQGQFGQKNGREFLAEVRLTTFHGADGQPPDPPLDSGGPEPSAAAPIEIEGRGATQSYMLTRKTPGSQSLEQAVTRRRR